MLPFSGRPCCDAARVLPGSLHISFPDSIVFHDLPLEGIAGLVAETIAPPRTAATGVTPLLNTSPASLCESLRGSAERLAAKGMIRVNDWLLPASRPLLAMAPL